MRSSRRDFGITLGRPEPLIRDRRIVVGVDQVMSDAGVIGLALEDRLQDRRGLELVRVGLVRRRRRHVQRQGIVHLRFVVVRIALRQLLHRLHIGLYARAVVGFVVAGVEHGKRIDVVALALRLRTDGLSLLERGEPQRQVARGRHADEGIVEQAERDAPIGDGAIRVGLQHVFEYFARRAVPERMLVPHCAVEPLLRRRVARGFEVHLSELRAGIVLRRRRLHEPKRGCCRQHRDRD